MYIKKYSSPYKTLSLKSRLDNAPNTNVMYDYCEYMVVNVRLLYGETILDIVKKVCQVDFYS
jgi:hypothetical protein